MKPHSASQSGYTLVELAIAVAILSVLMVAGLKGVQSLLISGQVNEQVKTVAKLSATANALFASSSTSSVSQTQMLNLGAWDASKAINGNITSSFGSFETITPNAAAIGDMAANTGFIYKISSVPQAACANLANGISGFVYALHVTPISGAAPADWTSDSSAVKAPGNPNLSLPDLANACALNTDFYLAIKP
jgi:prepilin-type N-terminal cleavage/methylation domain-containing protein